MTSDIQQTALKQYTRDGCAIFRNAIDGDLIQEARNHIE